MKNPWPRRMKQRCRGKGCPASSCSSSCRSGGVLKSVACSEMGRFNALAASKPAQRHRQRHNMPMFKKHTCLQVVVLAAFGGLPRWPSI
jgi:hypothetical protein